MHIFLDANICLDLLDTKRATSEASVSWYMKNKDREDLKFFFSGDFITTFYYVLTERKKIDKEIVVNAIDALCMEVTPFYLDHNDFIQAKDSFSHEVLDDFEDLMILHSVLRCGSGIFMTNDKHLLDLAQFGPLVIKSL